MAQIIDTSVLITMEQRGLTLADLLEALPEGEEEVVLAPFTVAELVTGIQRTPLSPRRVKMEVFLETLLAELPVLPFGLLEARTHGLVWAQLLAQGAKIGVADALIASTALTWGHAVLTEDAAHFGRVPGLEVVRPRWR